MNFRKFLTIFTVVFVLSGFLVTAQAADRENFYVTNLKADNLDLKGLLKGGITTTGNIWYVDSGSGSNGGGAAGKTKDKPFATVDYAVGKCTASNGDVIVVMPGHAESITTSTTLALDVAGISVIGLGTGASIPTLTYTTTTSVNVAISAASISVENILFTAGANADAMSAMVTISASDVTVKNCEFRQGNSSMQAERAIYITTGADRVNIKNNKIWTTTDAGAIAGIDFNTLTTASADDNLIAENVIFGDFTAAPVYGSYTGTRNRVINNEVTNYNAAESGIEFTAATTTRSVITGNLVSTDQPNTAIDPGATVQSLKGNFWERYGAADGSRYPFELFKSGEIRTAVLTAAALPQTLTNTLFAVDNGAIEILSLTGLVTTVIETQADECTLQYSPTTTLTTATALTTPVDVTGYVANSVINFDNTVAGGTLLNGAVLIGSVDGQPLVVPPGVLRLGCNASNTGNVTWTLRYLPATGDSVAYTTGS